jgi:hypothetical protein
MSNSLVAVEMISGDRNMTPAGRARTESAGVRYLFRRGMLRTWSMLFGRRKPQAAAPSAEEPSDLYRTAVHESGHCIVARLFGVPVQFATTIPDAELGFGGRAMIGFGPPANRTMGDNYLQVDEIARTVDQHMPREGESRAYAAEWFVAVHDNAIQFLAGGAAEAVIFGRANERTSRSDYAKARRYAATICTSDSSASAFLDFAVCESAELIESHREVLLALAAELVERRELDGAEIDRVIATALARQARDREFVRRADWSGCTQRAAAFEKDRPQ